MSHPVQALERDELTVLMPCLNEAQTLSACIGEAHRALQRDGIHGEILIADNGSADSSPHIAECMGARLVRVAHRGYGSAILGGMEAALGKFIVIGDADGSYDFGEIPRFLEKLRQGYDLVMGNRFRGTIQPRAMPFLHRYWSGTALVPFSQWRWNIMVCGVGCGVGCGVVFVFRRVVRYARSMRSK